MNGAEELLNDIAEREEALQESKRCLELKLGLEAARDHAVLSIPLGGKLLEEALAASTGVAEAEKEAEEAEKMLSLWRCDEEKLGKIMENLKNDTDKIRSLSIRLGAMIYEQCSFSLLDKETYRIVYDDIEEDRKLETAEDAPFFQRLLGSGKAKMRKMGDESRFVSYALIALDSPAPLAGENSVALLSSLKDAHAEKSGHEEEKKALLEKLQSERERGKAAERSISFHADRIRSLKKTEEDAFVSYGSYLFDKGHSWIDKDTPASLLDILEQLLDISREQEALSKEKERIEREARADDYRALIESEEGKILVLEKEKERIDREIAQIKKEIDSLKVRIERLGL